MNRQEFWINVFMLSLHFLKNKMEKFSQSIKEYFVEEKKGKEFSKKVVSALSEVNIFTSSFDNAKVDIDLICLSKNEQKKSKDTSDNEK